MSMSDRDGTSCAIRNQHINRCHFPYHLPLLLLLTPKKKDLTVLKWRGTCGEPFLRGSCESSKSRSKRLIELYIECHTQEDTCLQEEPRSNIQLQLRKPPPRGRAAYAHSGTESAAGEGHAGVRGSKARGLGSRTMKQSTSPQQIQPLLLHIAGSTRFRESLVLSAGRQQRPLVAMRRMQNSASHWRVTEPASAKSPCVKQFLPLAIYAVNRVF